MDWRFNNDAPILGAAAVGDLNRDGKLEVVIEWGIGCDECLVRRGGE